MENKQQKNGELIIQCLSIQSNYPSKGVFSSPFIPKKFGIWPIILHNENHAKFLAKRWLFSIFDLASRGPKKPKRGPHEGDKLCILVGTKHNPENFGILYFIIPK
jgi:hypothetical protein